MVHKTLLSWLTCHLVLCLYLSVSSTFIKASLPKDTSVSLWHQWNLTGCQYLTHCLSKSIIKSINSAWNLTWLLIFERTAYTHTHICMETTCVCRDHIRLPESTQETSLQQQYHVFEVSLFGFPNYRTASFFSLTIQSLQRFPADARWWRSWIIKQFWHPCRGPFPWQPFSPCPRSPEE